MRGPHRLSDNTPSRTEPGDMEHVHVRAEEFRLPQRRPPVEHLKERAPADSSVHASPVPVLIPSHPSAAPPAGGAPGYLLSPHRASGNTGDTRGELDCRELFDAA